MQPDLYVGFDPGTQYVGWCLLDYATGNEVAADCWKLKGKSQQQRLIDFLGRWATWEYAGSAVVPRLAGACVEAQHLQRGKSVQTIFAIVGARTWIEVELARARVPYSTVQPSQAKQAIASGGATKDEMVRMAGLLVSLDHLSATARKDAADAVGVARAGWCRLRLQEQAECETSTTKTP